jgi:translation initiation factor IF-3
MAHIDLGHAQMQKLVEEIKSVGEVESLPKLEGRQMFAMISPLKKKQGATQATATPDKKSETKSS